MYVLSRQHKHAYIIPTYYICWVLKQISFKCHIWWFHLVSELPWKYKQKIPYRRCMKTHEIIYDKVRYQMYAIGSLIYGICQINIFGREDIYHFLTLTWFAYYLHNILVRWWPKIKSFIDTCLSYQWKYRTFTGMLLLV